MHRPAIAAVLLLSTSALACTQLGGSEDGDAHDTEIISRIELTFTPTDGSPAIVAAFFDPDGDGGVSGEAEAITLAAGTTYALDIALRNDLVEPAVDIGAEIEAEAEQHMLFVADDAGLLDIAYADHESDYGENATGEDLPLGLAFTLDASAAGTGQLRVILRHLPELNGTPQKTADLPQLFADGASLPGNVDVDVSFSLTVQ